MDESAYYSEGKAPAAAKETTIWSLDTLLGEAGTVNGSVFEIIDNSQACRMLEALRVSSKSPSDTTHLSSSSSSSSDNDDEASSQEEDSRG